MVLDRVHQLQLLVQPCPSSPQSTQQGMLTCAYLRNRLSPDPLVSTPPAAGPARFNLSPVAEHLSHSFLGRGGDVGLAWEKCALSQELCHNISHIPLHPAVLLLLYPAVAPMGHGCHWSRATRAEPPGQSKTVYSRARCSLVNRAGGRGGCSLRPVTGVAALF